MSRSTLATGGLLAALAAVLLRTVTGPAGVGWHLLAWALFASAAWVSRRVPERRLAALVVGGGIVLAATGLAAPPSTSTDSFRYVWDGRVQAAGISPYERPPSDPALAGLRDAWLFPSDCAGLYPLPDGGCTRINRPTEPTIYPPVAQGYFLLVHWLSPAGARHQVLQVGGWVMAVVALLVLCRVAGARRAALWAWCPAVPVEAVNNAHVDMLGVLLVVLAFGTVRGGAGRGGAGWGGAGWGGAGWGGAGWGGAGRGALLGAAVAAKLLPATALPGALSGVLSGSRSGVPSSGPVNPCRTAWRRVIVTVVPAGLVVVLSYLPYVLASGGAVLGYLPGYLKEERYDGGGTRYAVLRLIVPDAWAPYAAIALLGLIALLVLRHGDPDRPWQGALLVSGSLLLLFTPGYSWYALLVVALAAMDGRWEWLGTALAGAVAYLDGDLGPAFYAAAMLAVLIGWVARLPHRSGRTPAAPHPVRTEHTDSPDLDHR
ncbi:hypothetical protein GCM10009850_105150 [Nonomuraea monospora]|uniref:DUF2029 domain-containing protein n=1 Tax=Nonomuraea monospora TaxID=568818 RepID=A0ABP5PWC2_9ACTN